VIDQHGGDAADAARYFIATNKLFIDRGAGIAELEGIASGSTAAAPLAKFALAQTRVADNRLDDAAAIYSELVASNSSVLAKDTINLELAKVYEKQGKRDEASNLYFTIAKTASEAKDAEGEPIPMSQAATEAKKKIEELDPERAKEIVEPAPTSPFGG
jgi:predicted negative regulator of RcsB-dependent stress response